MKLAAGTMITRNPEAVETTVGEEIVLMTIASGRCFGLGDTGSEVWRQITSPTTVEALEQRLRVLYTAPEGVMERDLDTLLEQWSEHGLIAIAPG